MKAALVLAFLAVSVVCALAAPLVRMESDAKWNGLGWRKMASALPTDTLKVQIAIKQENVEQLEKRFWEVSNPDSPLYRQYWTTQQVGQLISPTPERVAIIQAWLAEHGVAQEQQELSLHQDLLTARVTIDQATRLFSTAFYKYQHEESGRTLIRAERYHVPAHIQNQIDFVGGLLRFPPTHAKAHITGHGQTQRQLTEVPKTLPTESMDTSNFISVQSTFAPQSNPPYFPLQSSLFMGDGTVIGDYLIRCPDGSPARTMASDNSLISCTGQSAVSSPGYVQMQVLTNSTVYSWDAKFQDCAQYDPNDTTNLISLGRAKLIAKLNLPSSAFFCAISMSNLPNYERLSVVVGATYPNFFPSYTTYGESGAYLGRLWTPQKLKKIYNIPNTLKNTNNANSQSVAEFLGEYYSEVDLQRWLSFMDVTNNQRVQIVGPNNQSNPGGEATLDIQWMIGISTNVRTVFWSLGELHEGQEPFLQWLTDISNTNNPPLVHSVSYADEETTLSMDYMNRVNIELQKAGVRGLTMLFASGDDGVLGYSARTGCANATSFQPQFPSSSPYATSVGGTTYTSRRGELAASSRDFAARITTGGGFSNTFSMPMYQMTAVNQYNMYYNKVPQNYWNPNGRAYPDISGMSHNYLCLLAGSYLPIDGTSASTPLVASMLTLINDKLLSLGLPPLGFFNPLLYSLAAKNLFPPLFNDVTIGENGCVANRMCCTNNGFTASPGWDATTGFGTIIFDRLYQTITATLVPQ